MASIDYLPQQPMPQQSNPLQAMNSYLVSSGLLPRNTKLGNPQMIQVREVPDEPSGSPLGKWICTALYQRKLISIRQLIRMTNAHAIAILTHGDFVAWYGKNAGKLVKAAEAADFDFSSLTHLIERMFELYETEGLEASFQTYMHLCSALYQLFGRDQEDIEPFQNEFYFSSRLVKLIGSVKVFCSRLFWRQVPMFIKLRVVGI